MNSPEWGLFKGDAYNMMGMAFGYRFTNGRQGDLCAVPLVSSYYSLSFVPDIRLHSDSLAIDDGGSPNTRGAAAAFDDSPGNAIDPSTYLSTERDDLFATYVFFKSSRANSVWIPIDCVAWQWHAKALKKGTTWMFTVVCHPAPIYQRVISTLPMWTHELTP
jgi:hypothetical protein